jgi:hypothetical protein
MLFRKGWKSRAQPNVDFELAAGFFRRYVFDSAVGAVAVRSIPARIGSSSVTSMASGRIPDLVRCGMRSTRRAAA